MKVSEFHQRITKIKKNEISCETYENYGNPKIQRDNSENHKNLIIPQENNPNHDNLKIQYENYEIMNIQNSKRTL